MLHKTSRWAILMILFLIGCVAPWFFGTWEMWWFWPFTTCLAIGVCLAGVSMVAGGGMFPRSALWSFSACLPFCIYILARWWLHPVVFLDAERAVLLHWTGLLVAGLVVFFLRKRQISILFWLLFVSLCGMALYGILNHVIAESRHVLWAPRYEQYAGRATGPYFCPDHFAGAMELFVCMGLGLLLDRATRKGARLLGGLAVLLGSVGALMSLSRGSGMTLVVIMMLVVWVGFYQWPFSVRIAWRGVFLFSGLLLLMGAFAMAQGYRTRFVTYGGLHHISGQPEESLREQIVGRLLRTSRGRMFTGAYLAWRTSPWLGIGPGMHRNLWPGFAHSGDGVIETGQWPTLVNDDFHSYEVHSDWLELLQEHGVIGLLLFLFGCAGVLVVYGRVMYREAVDWGLHDIAYMQNPPTGHNMVLAGLLAMGAMGFHSLGDFNLQMPGTVWMLALLVGMGIRAACTRLDSPEKHAPAK